MNEDTFNTSLRRFLKKVGITSQREIERSVRDALASGRLKGHEKLPAKIRLTVRDASSGRVLTLSTVTAIHVQPPTQDDCKQAQPSGQQQNGQQQGGKCDDDAGAPANAQGSPQQSSPSAIAQGNRS